MPQRAELRSVRQVGALQERAARAVPAAVQDNQDGCWLRYIDSRVTWWAGAVLTHGPAETGKLATRIAVAENFYAAHGAPARFQVCPACPTDLDGVLSLRRYQWESAMSLQVASAEEIPRRLAAPPLRVELTSDPDSAWLRLWMTAQGCDVDPAPEWRLLHRVDRPSAYVTVFRSGRPVAVGRAVADTGWVGVFGMATLPDARGQGAARVVLAVLANWATDRGSSRMYLQVEPGNSAALSVYRRAGFEELCVYHYRTAACPEGEY